MSRRVLHWALAIALALFPLQAEAAGRLMLTQAGGAPPVTWTPTANPAWNAAGGGATATFTSQPIGTAASNRVVIVCVATNNGGPVSGVTIGGTSATAVVTQGSNASQQSSLWSLLVTSGTTATIVVTQASANMTGILVGALTTTTPASNSNATEVFGFLGDPNVTTSALSIPANGIGIVCPVSSQPGPATWNVGTQDYLISNAQPITMQLGHISASGSQTPSITGFNGNGFGMVAASWGP